jgi:hypothetical protein
VKGDNLQAIRTTRGELEKVSHALAEQLYKQQASGSGAQASEKDDNVKDGEVVDA